MVEGRVRPLINQIREKAYQPENPGYAVKYSDGTWLCYAHGYFTARHPFYARTFPTKKDAEAAFEESKEDIRYSAEEMPEFVEAWEPLVARLRSDIKELEQLNQISPKDVFEMTMSLEDILHRLNNPTRE